MEPPRSSFNGKKSRELEGSGLREGVFHMIISIIDTPNLRKRVSRISNKKCGNAREKEELVISAVPHINER
jgi:hypothetical protein